MTARAPENPDELLLGAHFSIAGGLHKALLRALEYQCGALQLFTKNATTWKEKTLTEKEIRHLNDAKKPCGSRVDRHAHIGDGYIGINGFAALMNDSRLNHIPKILETPKKKNGRDGDAINLKLLRKMVSKQQT